MVGQEVGLGDEGEARGGHLLHHLRARKLVLKVADRGFDLALASEDLPGYDYMLWACR